MKAKTILAVCIIAFIATTSPAFAWDPITHYHINCEANPGISEKYVDLYCDNGAGPDMFMFSKGDICDYAHSPDTRRDKDFSHKPNFAYLMLKTRGLNNTSPPYYASGLGWGGHIAADWVAHDLELFPIPKETDPIDKAIYGPPHLKGEFLYDYYMFLTRGTIELPLWFKPKQIYKGMVNYYLIDIYENNREWSDERIKDEALDKSPSESEIRKRIRYFNGAVAGLQTLYRMKASKDLLTGSIPLLLLDMRSRGTEENISLSVKTVRDWSQKLAPRNNIPPLSPIRFYPLPPVPLSSNQFTTRGPSLCNSLDLLAPFRVKPAWAEPLLAFSSLGEEGVKIPYPSETAKYLFWEDVLNQAEQSGILEVEEKTIMNYYGLTSVVS